MRNLNALYLLAIFFALMPSVPASAIRSKRSNAELGQAPQSEQEFEQQVAEQQEGVEGAIEEEGNVAPSDVVAPSDDVEDSVNESFGDEIKEAPGMADENAVQTGEEDRHGADDAELVGNGAEEEGEPEREGAEGNSMTPLEEEGVAADPIDEIGERAEAPRAEEVEEGLVDSDVAQPEETQAEEEERVREEEREEEVPREEAPREELAQEEAREEAREEVQAQEEGRAEATVEEEAVRGIAEESEANDVPEIPAENVADAVEEAAIETPAVPPSPVHAHVVAEGEEHGGHKHMEGKVHHDENKKHKDEETEKEKKEEQVHHKKEKDEKGVEGPHAGGKGKTMEGEHHHPDAVMMTLAHLEEDAASGKKPEVLEKDAKEVEKAVKKEEPESKDLQKAVSNLEEVIHNHGSPAKVETAVEKVANAELVAAGEGEKKKEVDELLHTVGDVAKHKSTPEVVKEIEQEKKTAKAENGPNTAAVVHDLDQAEKDVKAHKPPAVEEKDLEAALKDEVVAQPAHSDNSTHEHQPAENKHPENVVMDVAHLEEDAASGKKQEVLKKDADAVEKAAKKEEPENQQLQTAVSNLEKAIDHHEPAVKVAAAGEKVANAALTGAGEGAEVKVVDEMLHTLVGVEKHASTKEVAKEIEQEKKEVKAENGPNTAAVVHNLDQAEKDANAHKPPPVVAKDLEGALKEEVTAHGNGAAGAATHGHEGGAVATNEGENKIIPALETVLIDVEENKGAAHLKKDAKAVQEAVAHVDTSAHNHGEVVKEAAQLVKDAEGSKSKKEEKKVVADVEQLAKTEMKGKHDKKKADEVVRAIQLEGDLATHDMKTFNKDAHALEQEVKKDNPAAEAALKKLESAVKQKKPEAEQVADEKKLVDAVLAGPNGGKDGKAVEAGKGAKAEAAAGPDVHLAPAQVQQAVSKIASQKDKHVKNPADKKVVDEVLKVAKQKNTTLEAIDKVAEKIGVKAAYHWLMSCFPGGAHVQHSHEKEHGSGSGHKAEGAKKKNGGGKHNTGGHGSR